MKNALKNARILLLISLILAASFNIYGQSTAGTITGVVKDSSGAVVAGATVAIRNPATGLSQTVSTQADGAFVVPNLPPGAYSIEISANGFKQLRKDGFILSPGDRASAGELELQVGAASESVTVTADQNEAQLKTESGERSDLITNRQIKDLALNGRNPFDLMKTIPGVVSNVDGQVSAPSGLNNFAINGARGNQKEVTIDGSSNVDTGGNGSVHVTINPDAIAEVKILTSNYQAEYGKAAGGSISFVTKSGTNEFHGTGRFFHRHEGLNANDFFRNAEGRNADGSERQPRQLYRYNYFGYDIGGPLYIPGHFNTRKDKLFFFWNQEYYRQLVPAASTRNLRVPTPAELTGDFSKTTDGNGNRVFIKDPLSPNPCTATNQTGCFPGNLIPLNRIYAGGQGLLKLLPAPNFDGGPQFNNSTANSSTYPRREDIVRIDYNISGNTRLAARFINNFDEQRAPYGIGFGATTNFPLTEWIFPHPGSNASLTLTHTFNPTLVNEFIFGPSRNLLQIYAADDKALRSGSGVNVPELFPAANPAGYVPGIQFGSLANQTFPSSAFNGLPWSTDNWTFNFIDNLTKVFTGHTVKTGLFVQHSRKDQLSLQAPTNGLINFSSAANNPLNTGHPYSNALLGIYQSYQQASNHPLAKLRYLTVEWYAQDTWKVNRRFTLDYGLRLGYLKPQGDADQQLAFFEPSLYDASKQARLYEPILVGNATRAVDPANRPASPTAANTLPSNLIGFIVPGSGLAGNGMGLESKGYPSGGMEVAKVVFGPRLGFAFDVFGTGTSVLRGGFGISYDRIGGNLANNTISNPPNSFTPTLFFGQLQELKASAGTTSPTGVTGTPRAGKIPNVLSFSFGFQRKIGFSTVVDVSYVGTLSRHLGLVRNLNAIPYGATFRRENQDPTRFAGGVVPAVEPNLPAVYAQAGLSFSGTFAKRAEFLRPFPDYNAINFREFVGTANYNALQVTANRRFSKHLTFGLAYTWSKNLTTANNDTETVHPFDTRRYDYRLAAFDRPHVLVANYVYDLPAFSRWLGGNKLLKLALDGYQLSGISTFSSGPPNELGFGIQGINAGQRVTGSYTEGPRLIPTQALSYGPTGLVYDPGAFLIPAIGSVGMGPRNYLRNPGSNNHDLSVFKNFRFSREQTRYLQLRVELFNAFNHTQFSGINQAVQLTTPTGTIGDTVFARWNQLAITNNLRPNGSTAPLGRFFGEFNNARDPRIIQLGVKLYF